MNVVGVMVFRVIVAIGGGTIRDLLLGQLPVYWIDDPTPLIIAAIAALVTIPLFKIGTISVPPARKWTDPPAWLHRAAFVGAASESPVVLRDS